MKDSSKRFFLVVSLSLCFVLTAVLVTLGSVGPALRLVFATYQFFLIGVCVGALAAATVGLMVEREDWTHYRTYFAIVMISAFLLVVVNSVIFRVLDGEHFVQRLLNILWVAMNSR